MPSSYHPIQPPAPPSQRHSVFTSNRTTVSASLRVHTSNRTAVSASLYVSVPSQRHSLSSSNRINSPPHSISPTRTTRPSGSRRPSTQHRKARVPLCRSWHCRRAAARRVGSRNSRRARGCVCVCVCVCVLSHWVHAARVEVPDLPSLKCSSHWSLGLCPAYAGSWVRRCYPPHFEMNLTSTQWPTPTYRGRELTPQFATLTNAVRTCLTYALNPSSNPDPTPNDRIVFHTQQALM
jgi:hypothetical protein